jgi:hypothetical protein
MSAYTQLINTKGFKLKVFVIVVAGALVLVKMHDPLLPAFIAISHIAMLAYDYWKLRSAGKGAEVVNDKKSDG